MPRISAIENPKNLISRIGFRMIKKEVGKVTIIAKVIYSRFPAIMMITKKIFDAEKKMSITGELKLLIQAYVATLNGCTFCIDISKRRAIDNNYSFKKFGELPKDVTVSDITFTELSKHWSEREIIEITFVAAAENYLNRLAKPLGIGSDELCAL